MLNMFDTANPETRRAMFLAFCAFFVLLAGGYIVRSGGTADEVNSGGTPAPDFIENLPSVDSPGLLFASAAFDQTNGHVAFAAPQALAAPPRLTRLRCERVHISNGVGVCLAADRGFLTTYTAHMFGPDFRIRSTVPLQGPPSRARVSPDGSRAAMTVFVSGDSYASTSFSTRTTLLEAATGRVIADLEQFAVTRAGAPFKAVDFNFWGVTFARDSNRVFATLRTSGANYLIEGNIDAKTATVLREGVECPSLSPDNTLIVFKKRVGASSWRLHMLDIATGREKPLAEVRNVDDQAEWLDAESIAYALPSAQSGTGGGSDIWTLNVHTDSPPTLLVARAHSPASVR
jgi:hypothetical protein